MEFDQKSGRKFFNSFGWVYVFTSVVSFSIQILANSLFRRFAPNLLSTMNGLILCMMLPVYLIAYPIGILLIKKVPATPRPEEPKLKLGFKGMFWAFVCSYALMYICNFVGMLISLPKTFYNQDATINPLASVVLNSNSLVQLVMLTIAPPIFEEIIFRKLLIDRVRRYGEGIAIFLSGLVFALYHGNIVQFFYAFTLGSFFAYIYVKTDNIKYTMGLHLLINFMGSVAGGSMLKLCDIEGLLAAVDTGDQAFLASYISGHMGGIILYISYVIILFIIVIMGIVRLIKHRKEFQLQKTGIDIPKGKRFSTIIVNWGMAVFTVFWIGMIVHSYIFE